MKNSNKKYYMTSPIALMASVVAAAENSVNPDYRMEAENMVKLYSDLSSDAIVSVCEAPCTELMSEEDNMIVLNFIHSEFGKIHSFTVHKFNSETSLYKLECSKGTYKMILVLDSENRISAIDFSKVEIYEMNLAA
ncbi:MAG: hypothetical protein ABI855_03620 [Bacteroidota bacterium]